uniref:RGS domain-containing protein n=1 Tax=Rhabditophanes sp. KR3021 TaxID=114890 RepID=A0AC35UIN6_9BILA
MGNSESSLRNSFPSTKSSVAESSRRPAKKQVKIFTTHSNSSSPNPETGRKRSDSANEVSRNSTSLNYHQQKHSTDRSNRRTKSFRAGIGNTGSFRHRNGLGSAAELSNTQKRLIQLIFEETDKLTFYDFVHNVFQTIFSRDKRLLKVIGLEVCERYQDDVWEQHINFKMHNQKFCNTLIDCIENIFDTTLVLDCLREFGATYAVDFNGTVKVPTNYWDRLEAAITSKAKELKQLDITKNSVFLLGNKQIKQIADIRFLVNIRWSLGQKKK